MVITDLSMSGLSGIDFVNLLRRSPDSPNPLCP
jgi:two-component system chemotaxis response regulator CheY